MGREVAKKLPGLEWKGNGGDELHAIRADASSRGCDCFLVPVELVEFLVIGGTVEKGLFAEVGG